MSNIAVVGVVMLVIVSGAGGAVAADATDFDTSETIPDGWGVEMVADLSDGLDTDDPVDAVFGDLSISTPSADFDFDLSMDDQTVTTESDSIDEDTEDAVSTGMCAVGLEGDSSPVNMDVDGEEGEVETNLNGDASGENPQSSNAQEVIDDCTDH